MRRVMLDFIASGWETETACAVSAESAETQRTARRRTQERDCAGQLMQARQRAFTILDKTEPLGRFFAVSKVECELSQNIAKGSISLKTTKAPICVGAFMITSDFLLFQKLASPRGFEPRFLP